MSYLDSEHRRDNLEVLLAIVLTTVVRVLPTGRPASLAWKDLIVGLADNQADPKTGRMYLGLREAPAAKRNHHAELGGLVQHYIEMWDLYKEMGPRLFRSIRTSEDMHTAGEWEYVTRERVLEGILLHDLSKAYFTFEFLTMGESTTIDYGDHPSGNRKIGGMLRDDQKSLWIAGTYGLSFDLVQLNALYHSEGGWAECPPRWDTVLSKLLYLLDELSGNVWARNQAGCPVMASKGEPTPRLTCDLWAGGGKSVVGELPIGSRGLDPGKGTEEG